MFEFCYDYIKEKYVKKIKPVLHSFIIHIKTEDSLRWYLKWWFDKSNCELESPFQSVKMKMGMEDNLGGAIMKEFIALRTKMCP